MPKSKHRNRKRPAEVRVLRCDSCGARAIGRCKCPDYPRVFHNFCGNCHVAYHKHMGADPPADGLTLPGRPLYG